MTNRDVWHSNIAKLRQNIENDVLLSYPELNRILEWRFFGNSETQKVLNIEALLTKSNSGYFDSDYFYKNDNNQNLEFVHFTSLESLEAIIKTQSLKLSSLNSVNDPNEINYASSIFELKDDFINDQKKSNLSFSLCEFLSSDAEIENNFNNLDLWRLYGQDGKGVSIKFKILNDPYDWEEYHIASIKYGQAFLNYWKPLKESIDKFNSSNAALYLHLIKLFSFHKDIRYKGENEVRLLFSAHYDYNENKLAYNTRSNKNETYPKILNIENKNFNFLPLFNPLQNNLVNNYLSRAPKIIIDEIKLGFQFSKSDLESYIRKLNNLLMEYAGYSLDTSKITISDLDKIYTPK